MMKKGVKGLKIDISKENSFIKRICIRRQIKRICEGGK